MKNLSAVLICGFDIDSELANLNQNLETRLLKVEALILRWERRNLTTSGRVAISKAILLSQFIYFLQVLDVDKTDICEKIEKTLHNFIKGKTKRNWISADMINTPKSKGGLGLFNIRKFTMSLKAAFILRYVRGTEDHWCDRIDQALELDRDNRKEILSWGDLRFEKIIKEKLVCISSIFTAWKALTKHFPTGPDSRDNSWICQALFHNSNITTKIPTNNARGFKMASLEPIYFGFPHNCCIKIIDIYRGGIIKPREEISTLIKDKYDIQDYDLEEGSYLRLKRAMKFILGMRETMEGRDIIFPMTIPVITPNPTKYSSSTMSTLAKKN